VNLKNIAFETTNKELSANTGIIFLNKLFGDHKSAKSLQIQKAYVKIKQRL